MVETTVMPVVGEDRAGRNSGVGHGIASARQAGCQWSTSIDGFR
jgi:hypothetical protein